MLWGRQNRWNKSVRKFFDSNWIMFALHCANAIIIIIIIAIVIIVIIIIISKRFKNKLLIGGSCLSSCDKQGKSNVYSILKIKTGTNQVSSMAPSRYTCGETYIGEAKRNFAVRKAEHENMSHKSKPARHLAKHPTHEYTWNIE